MFRYAIETINNQQADAAGSGSTEDDPAEAIRIKGLGGVVDFGNEFQASKRLCRMLKNGLVAVFGPTAAASSQHCMNVCDAKELPYIDFRWDADTRPPVVNMMPHPDAMAQLYVDLIRAWNWKGFTILYESAQFLPRVAELLKLYEPKEYTVTVRRINAGLTDNNYRSVLRRVRLAEDVHILLECSIDVLPELLKQAQQVGLMTDRHQFIVTSPDMHTIDLEPFQYSGTNITGVRMVNPESPLVVQVTAFIAEAEGGAATEGGGGGDGGGGGGGGGDDDDADAEEEAGSTSAELADGLTAERMRTQTALIFDAVLLLTEAMKQLNAEQIRPKRLNCNNAESWENGHSITNFMRNVRVVDDTTKGHKYNKNSSFGTDNRPRYDR